MNVRALCLGVLMATSCTATHAQPSSRPFMSAEEISQKTTQHHALQLQRRAQLEEAQHQATLLEAQERAAAALARCAEYGVRCGLDRSLADLSAPDVVTDGHPTSAEPPPPPPPAGPSTADALFEHLQRTPRSVPVLEGVVGHRALFRSNGQALTAGQGDALPGGWVVKSVSQRDATLAHPSGEVRHLSLRWRTGAHADQPVQQAVSNPGSAPLLNLPGPEWMQ